MSNGKVMIVHLIAGLIKKIQCDLKFSQIQTNLTNLKTELDKLDIDKLVPVPTDLSKL